VLRQASQANPNVKRGYSKAFATINGNATDACRERRIDCNICREQPAGACHDIAKLKRATPKLPACGWLHCSTANERLNAKQSCSACAARAVWGL